MKFVLKNAAARLLNVNPRPELHGEDKKPAADLKLSVILPNSELDQLHPKLRHLLYAKDTSQRDLVSQDDPNFMTALVFPQLTAPLKWSGEQVGGKLTVHRGISAKSDLVIEGPILNEFRLEPLEGGSCVFVFRAQFRPDEKAIGRLCMLTGQDLEISVEPPAEGELAAQEEEPEEQPA